MATNNVQAIDVAQYIVDRFYAKQESITTMKLQKLVYYSQAWSLAWECGPLFDEDFEAWINGPVVRSLFKALKGYYYAPMTIPGADVAHLSDDQKDTINRVLERYGDFTAPELIAVTHADDPWKQARGDLSESTASEQIISKDLMANFYSGLIDEE